MYKRIVVISLIVVFAVVLTGCDNQSEYQTNRVVEDQQTIYLRNQPVPMFDWSQDRDTLIQIYKQKNESRSTFTIISSSMGETIFTCPSMGYAIPADTQLTNPVKALSSTGAVVEQPEPNGLFSSKNTVGTYVICVRDNGDIVPIYTELNVTTFPFYPTEREGRFYDDGTQESTIKIEKSTAVDRLGE